MQKPNLAFRRILLAIDTYSYNLSKLLVSVLNPLLTSPFIISDSLSFHEDSRSPNFDTINVFMASFDINSLFTNVPLDETFDIIINKAFHNTTLFRGFSASQLRKLLSLSVKNCNSLFNDCLYEQTDGVAMDSPLGPLLANIFLAFHESCWLAICPADFKPVYFRSYTDDCFVIFHFRHHVRPFLDYLNPQRLNITFTDELGVNSTLSFLDVLIDRPDGFWLYFSLSQAYFYRFTH